MNCPKCTGQMVYWSDSTAGSYGWGCESCFKFWSGFGPGETPHSIPLDLAHFPDVMRAMPRYRALVGWK